MLMWSLYDEKDCSGHIRQKKSIMKFLPHFVSSYNLGFSENWYDILIKESIIIPMNHPQLDHVGYQLAVQYCLS